MLLSQQSVRSDRNGLISQITRLMTMVRTMASVRLDLAHEHHGREHAADHHADQDAEGDEGGEQQAGHAILFTARAGEPRLAARRAERSQNPATEDDRLVYTYGLLT